MSSPITLQDAQSLWLISGNLPTTAEIMQEFILYYFDFDYSAGEPSAEKSVPGGVLPDVNQAAALFAEAQNQELSGVIPSGTTDTINSLIQGVYSEPSAGVFQIPGVASTLAGATSANVAQTATKSGGSSSMAILALAAIGFFVFMRKK